MEDSLTASARPPRCGPYTFESMHGPRIKDPVNVAFIDMAGGLLRVVDIVKTIGFSFGWGVGDQFFAEPDANGVRHIQDENRATRPVGINGRDHIRIHQLYSGRKTSRTVVASVHRERWPQVGWFPFLKKTCDAVESFDAPRRDMARRLSSAGFLIDEIDIGNCNPLPQCDGSFPRSDGRILLVREPG